jgi:hypothetical protein
VFKRGLTYRIFKFFHLTKHERLLIAAYNRAFFDECWLTVFRYDGVDIVKNRLINPRYETLKPSLFDKLVLYPVFSYLFLGASYYSTMDHIKVTGDVSYCSWFNS